MAIVFDTGGLEKLMEDERGAFAHSLNHIGDVKYDNDDIGIQKKFHEVFEYFPGILDAHYSGQQQPGYEKMFDHFVMGTTLTKHHAFHEEREILLVVSPRLTDQSTTFYDNSRDSKKIKMIRYRRRGDREIRYIELFGNAPLPIKRIIIGPSKIQNVNYQTICDMTKGSEIDVSKSLIPFLG